MNEPEDAWTKLSGSVVASSVLVVLVLLLSGPSLTHWGGTGPAKASVPRLSISRGPNALVHPLAHVVSQVFSGTSSVYTLGSLGVKALSAVSLPNFSIELVLSDARTNTSSSLGLIPGGSGITTGTITAAGGAFFVAIQNTTTNAQTYDRVSVSGVVTTVHPPLTPYSAGGYLWSFPYGNSTALVATAEGRLLILNPSTLAVATNFSSAIPSTLTLNSVLPSGSLLYLAGTLSGTPSPRTSAWFGALDTTTRSSTRISPLHFVTGPANSAFWGMAAVGGDIYVGGGVDSFSNSPLNVHTSYGLFFRYSPANATWTNRSSLLPSHNESVFSVSPWGSTVLVYQGGFAITSSSFWEAGGIYLLGPHGGKLVNKSALLPSGFLVDFYSVTSVSGGYIFLGGSKTASGLAQLAAIHP